VLPSLNSQTHILTWSSLDLSGSSKELALPIEEVNTLGREQTDSRDDYLLSVITNREFWWAPAQFIHLSLDQVTLVEPPAWQMVMAPGFEQLLRNSPGAESYLDRQPSPDILTVLKQHGQVVLLGDPGSGKTTALRNLTFEIALEGIRNDQSPIPLYLPLAAADSETRPEDWIRGEWAKWGPRTIDYEGVSRSGLFVLLLDGLNELPGDRAGRQTTEWSRFLAQPLAPSAVVTCRLMDYDIPLAMHQIEIRPLEPRQVRQLAEHLIGNKSEEFLTSELVKDCAPFMTNPLYVGILAWLYGQDTNHETISSRASALWRFFEILCQRAFGDRGRRRLGVAQRLLTAAAWQMQIESSISLTSEAIESLSGVDSSEYAAALVEAAKSSNILVESSGALRFAHHQLQELLAGRQMETLLREGKSAQVLESIPTVKDLKVVDPHHLLPWQRLPLARHSGWSEPLKFAMAYSANPEELMRCVLQRNPLLAAELALVRGGDHASSEMSLALVELLEEGLSTSIRVTAGMLLGEVGDPRLATDPDGIKVSTVCIKGEQDYAYGKFPITVAEYRRFIDADGYRHREHWTRQGWEWRHKGSIENGVVAGMLANRSNLIGSGYPLEYWRRHYGWGPETLEFWDEFTKIEDSQARDRVIKKFERRNAQAPAFWNRDDYMLPNMPIVGITRFEAEAYCHWLESMTGIYTRIQRAEEWAFASRGASDTDYPWGDEAGLDFANTAESHLLQPSPVGSFPEDRSRLGAFDFAGNVREWTCTIDKERNVSGTVPHFIVKGGAWSRSLRVATRHYSDSFAPDFWDYNLGMRIVQPQDPERCHQ
jgi:formylglycine-generating enzyme required for sulfatase activity